MSMKDGWRSARGEGGGQCVMIDGMNLMQLWCADSLEYLLVVRCIRVAVHLFTPNSSSGTLLQM